MNEGKDVKSLALCRGLDLNLDEARELLPGRQGDILDGYNVWVEDHDKFCDFGERKADPLEQMRHVFCAYLAARVGESKRFIGGRIFVHDFVDNISYFCNILKVSSVYITVQKVSGVTVPGDKLKKSITEADGRGEDGDGAGDNLGEAGGDRVEGAAGVGDDGGVGVLEAESEPLPLRTSDVTSVSRTAHVWMSILQKELSSDR